MAVFRLGVAYNQRQGLDLQLTENPNAEIEVASSTRIVLSADTTGAAGRTTFETRGTGLDTSSFLVRDVSVTSENGTVLYSLSGVEITPANPHDIAVPSTLVPHLAGDDEITGSFGNDLLDGLRGDDEISLGLGDDTGFGSEGNDTVFGQDGDDLLIGAQGADSLIGGRGDDFLRGGQNEDTLRGGSGDDTLQGARDADLVIGNQGDDIIRLGSDDDVARGGRDDDTIFAARGDDTVRGGAGDDVITGGVGNDQLSGGAGADQFVFRGNTDDDVITDFNTDGGDQIVLRAFNFGTFADFAEERITSVDGDAVITLDGGTITLEGVDANSLSADDFIF